MEHGKKCEARMSERDQDTQRGEAAALSAAGALPAVTSTRETGVPDATQSAGAAEDAVPAGAASTADEREPGGGEAGSGAGAGGAREKKPRKRRKQPGTPEEQEAKRQRHEAEMERRRLAKEQQRAEKEARARQHEQEAAERRAAKQAQKELIREAERLLRESKALKRQQKLASLEASVGKHSSEAVGLLSGAKQAQPLAPIAGQGNGHSTAAHEESAPAPASVSTVEVAAGTSSGERQLDSRSREVLIQLDWSALGGRCFCHSTLHSGDACAPCPGSLAGPTICVQPRM